MRQSEPYHRNTRNESFQPRNRSYRTTSGGASNESVGERIIALYTSGQSIESISREVGRARHFVVHLLQTRGVFGNRPAEAESPEPETDDAVLAVEEAREEPAVEEPKPKPEPVAVVQAVEEPAVVEKPARKVRLRKSGSTKTAKPPVVEKAKAKPVPFEKPAAPARFSPELVEALFKVVSKGELNTGISHDEVKKLVSKSR